MDTLLVQYISDSLKQGKTQEALYQELLAKGLKLWQIRDLFLQATAPAEIKEETQKKTIMIVATIGALLIGLGVFSFVASNWQSMTREGRMAVVLFSMVVADALGWYLKTRNLSRSGESLMFLGSLLFGAAVFLAAQMYNTRVYWPDGFLWWGMGSLAAAAVTELKPLYWLAVFAGFVGLVWYPIGIFMGGFYNPLILTPWVLLIISFLAFITVGQALRRKFLKESPDQY